MFTISVGLTYTALLLGNTPYPVAKTFVDLVLQLGGINTHVADTNYINALGGLLNVMGIVLAIASFIVPALSYAAANRRAQRRSIIQSYLISEQGREDLAVMREHYADAERIIVFSGDFSWIIQDEDLRQVITRLSQDGKITLVSYKSQSEIEKRLKNDGLYASLENRFTHKRGLRLKCSIIRKGNVRTFLYRSDKMENGHRESRVYVVTETDESRYLLEVLESLCHKIAGI